jgi:RsiW-degrading membrane proteinase PrsW (M82 family)
MRPNWRTVVPVSAAFSFYLAANLFLLILGRGRVSRWTVLKCTAATLVAASALCLSLRAAMLFERTPPDAHFLRGLFDALARGVRFALSGESLPAKMMQAAGTITLEEIIKLAPVFVLIARGRITSAHGAMLCGALAGLTFGTVEAISYGYLNYPTKAEPVPTYLTRFFVMSPLHGIWDALAGGLVFFLSGRARSNTARRPNAGAFAAAFGCAMIFHVAHNALQHAVGAVMQIVTVFALLAPMYLLAKLARRQAASEGAPDTGQLVGDLHLLTISMATLFLAAGVTFSWLLGLQPPSSRGGTAPVTAARATSLAVSAR